ncbi:MAG: hypothetical protein AAGD96_22595, partial [Chloroflexota bacterium]
MYLKQNVLRTNKKLSRSLRNIGATLAAMLLLLLTASHFSDANAAINSGIAYEQMQAPFATTITVNSTEDVTAEDAAENNANKHTCTYTSGAFFFPANGSSAGQCTLRRAILEASARPQSDRPILIEFDLKSNDPNADQEVTGTWTIELDEALPEWKTDTIINLNGQVTLDGDTQTGGRNDGPKIIIDTGDTSLIMSSTDNIIRNISWKGGG